MRPSTSESALEALIQIHPSDLTSNSVVELTNSRGDLLGSLLIPLNLTSQSDTTLTVFYAKNIPSVNGEALASPVLNITLLDNEGTFVTQLDSPLTICLAHLNETKKEGVCLSYYDEQKSKWRCEDECLVTNRSRKDNLLCGQTDHLTNFALLLNGKESRTDLCQSSQQDNTLSWVSFGMVLGAVVLVCLCGLVIEVQIRYRRYKRKKFISKSASLWSLPFSIWVQQASPSLIQRK